MIKYLDIRPKGTLKDWVPENSYQQILVDNMLNTLNTIEEYLPKGDKLIIIEGVADPNLITRIEDNEFIDHLYGKTIDSFGKLTNSFGDHFSFSIGAADIRSLKMPSVSFYKFILNLYDRNRIQLGCATLHRGYPDSGYWVHITNDPYYLYGPSIGSLLRKSEKFIYTDDGGVTFDKYEPDGRTKEGRKLRE